MSLKVLTDFPSQLFRAQSVEVDGILDGPTIIHLNKESKDHLFISCLLHGNETTGFYAMVNFVKSILEENQSRGVIIFIGNTKAAKFKLRHLPNQKDFNRIWCEGDSNEEQIAKNLLRYCSEFNLFAAIDIHNNTGKNPYYGCINYLKEDFLNLARAFSKKVVYFTEPKEVCSMAMAKFAPSVTIEAGQPDLVQGIDKVTNYLLKIFHLKSFDQIKSEHDYPVFYTNARIKVNKTAKIDFRNELSKNIDISLISTLELLNFDFIQEGKALGWCKDPNLFYVQDNEGFDVTEQYFEFVDQRIITKRMFIPSMFTMDETILKEDCLGYIMQVLKKS